MSTVTEASVSRRSLHDLSFPALEREIVESGLRPAHALTLWGAMHRQAGTDLLGHETFLPPLRRWLQHGLGKDGRFFAESLEVVTDVASSDGLTRKFLLRLNDGETIETVIMGYPGRFTACISTQAGCAMGCVFCATGQMGFARHLRPAEMVAQVLHAQRTLRASGHTGLRNIVLMGMGEPLHNYNAVMDALEIITDTRGINVGPSRISVSTVGVVPGILRMADERRPYNLAVSLHAATEPERAALLPISRRWPLSELIEACRTYCASTGRRIFFAWTLISGVNDSPAHAEQLATLLTGVNAHVNLIPLNGTSGFTGISATDGVARNFQQVLNQSGLPSTIRQRRGIDVAAGCGQLRSGGSESEIASSNIRTTVSTAVMVQNPL